MSCYGGPVETPNIDRIAADGVRFTQWHHGDRKVGEGRIKNQLRGGGGRDAAA